MKTSIPVYDIQPRSGSCWALNTKHWCAIEIIYRMRQLFVCLFEKASYILQCIISIACNCFCSWKVCSLYGTGVHIENRMCFFRSYLIINSVKLFLIFNLLKLNQEPSVLIVLLFMLLYMYIILFINVYLAIHLDKLTAIFSQLMIY